MNIATCIVFSMNRAAQIGLRLVVLFIAVFTVAGGAAYFTIHSAKFKSWLETELSQRSGFDVRLAFLHYHPPFGIVAESVELSQAGKSLVTASDLTATVMPWDALFQTVTRVGIKDPVLKIDLDSITSPSSQTTTKIALRRLNIQNGTIVLTKGQATVLELPKINLTAENLNLGEQAGIYLRADVPPLNGDAELRMTGAPRSLETDVVVRSKQSPATGELLRLRARLLAPENQKANVSIEAKAKELVIGATKITGDLAARLEIDAPWKVASLTARGALTEFASALHPPAGKFLEAPVNTAFAGVFDLQSKTLSLRSVEIASPLGAGAGQAELVFDAPARVARANLTVRDIPLDRFKSLLPTPLEQWMYRGEGALELDCHGAFDSLEVKGVARADSLEIRSGALNVAGLAVNAPFEWSKNGFHVHDTKLVAAKAAYGAKDRWQASVERAQASASFEFKAGEPITIRGEIATRGGKFSSPDGSKVGENLTLAGPFEIIPLSANTATRLTGKFRADSGELLWGKFFGDLKTDAPALELNVDYLSGSDRFDCHPCKITLMRVGTVEMTGAIENLSRSPELRLQARSANFLPGGFFDFALRDTFKRQYPVLDKISVDGQMNFQMNFAGSATAPAIDGELSLKSGALRAKDGDWQIGPVALNLPFQITLSERKREPTGSSRRGSLSIERMFFGKESVGSLEATFSLWNNTLQFHQPIRAAVFGGEIEIANLLWPDVLGDPQRLSFSAAAKRLQLARLTAAANWHPFTGTLTGSIPEVQSAENLLRTSGEIQAEVFGGRVSIAKLEIENPFSTLASIKLNARLSGIQLEQLSRTFEFGGISGILEGSIDDLVMTDNQPSQFRADVHSVDRGTEQRISVEALNKITVLSSGENAGALYGGLASFFDSFRYSKLGFKASLRNDRLTLRGVESRDDQEFLVVGSFLPPTVNIISHTQSIAFSELMRRLERIKENRPEVK